MKKKISIIIIALMLQVICLTTVHAYNIEVKADYPDIVLQGDYVRYRMYTAASVPTADYFFRNVGAGNWLNSMSYNPSPTTGTFITKGIFFHEQPNCSYPGGGNTKYYYSQYSSEYIGNDIKNMTSISNINIPASEVMPVSYDERLYRSMGRGLGADYGEERMTVIKTQASNGNMNNIYVADDYLSVNYVNEILDEFEGAGEIYFSYDNQTLLPGGSSMKTSSQFYNVTNGRWFSNTKGYLNYDINQPNGLLSGINYYDNIMKLPERTKGKKIYVRHINIKDADIEKLSNSDLSDRLAGNAYAPVINSKGDLTGRSIKSNPSGDYQEIYEVRGNEGLSINKASSGLEYLGYVRATKTSERDRKIIPKLKVSGNSKSTQVEVLPNFKEDAIYIDFFYREEDTKKKTEKLSGTLNFQSILKDGMTGGAFENMTEGQNNQNLSQDYVPSDEILKAGVLNAHPYVLEALDLIYYERNGSYGDTRDKGYETVNITVERSYLLEYEAKNCDEYNDKGGCKEPGECEETSASGTISYTKTYYIPYSYQYYKIKNFKLFKLKDVVLHDTSGQEGGQLFENADGNSLNLNQNYENRFNPSKSYARVEGTNHWVEDSNQTITIEPEYYGTAGCKKAYARKGKTEEEKYIESEEARIRSQINSLSDSEFAGDSVATMYVRNDSLVLEGIPLIDQSLKEKEVLLRNYGTRKNNTGPVVELDCTKPNIGLIKALRPGNTVFDERYGIKAMQMNEYTNWNQIPLTRENGKRVLSATLEYRLIDSGTLNVGAQNDNDNIRYYPNYMSVDRPDPKWTYNKVHDVDEKDKIEPVVVHTPIKTGGYLQNSSGIIDQTTVGEIPSDAIQKNSTFQIVPDIGGTSIAEHPRYQGKYSGPITFSKYIKGHFVSFNFDVQVPGRGEKIYSAGSWIYFAASEPIVVQANKRIDEGMGNVVETKTNTYKLRTLAINANDRIIERVVNGDLDMSYIGNGEDNENNIYNAHYAGGTCYQNGAYIWAHGKRLSVEATYIAETPTKNTSNLDRMYDIRVTDLADPDWRNVYRKYDGTHTSLYHTAGRRGWNMYSGDLNESGNITGATSDGFRTDIGSDPYRTMPLGPYKHSNSQYVSAPKMGYRFAFDLKTTGKINKNQAKVIDIKVSFYYISKDGNTYYNSDEIDLYYQNSSGKYVKIENGKNNGYTIKMRPNDGYRFIDTNYVTNTLSKDLVEISKDLVNLKLNSSTNMTLNEKDFTQIWYGEYKLPNSTIAVLNKNAGGSSDINKPLKDGYIGVKFDIILTETENGEVIRKLTYSTNAKDKGENSSQWDYEGHFSIYDAVKANPVTTGRISDSNTAFVPLEKGKDTQNGAKGLKVGNTVTFNKYTSSGNYNKVSISGNQFMNEIKGTMIMYDADAKASEDFDFGAK